MSQSRGCQRVHKLDCNHSRPEEAGQARPAAEKVDMRKWKVDLKIKTREK